MTTTTTQVEVHRLQRLALSAREVAHLLGISERQVWRLTAADALPKPRRVGARARWDRATVLEWWEQQREA